MCEKCKDLLNVPVGKKAIVKLYESNNSIGARVDETIMVVDNGGITNAYITNIVVLDNARTYQHPIDIKYCPFCGEPLIK
jgi:hypothetical protein